MHRVIALGNPSPHWILLRRLNITGCPNSKSICHHHTTADTVSERHLAFVPRNSPAMLAVLVHPRSYIDLYSRADLSSTRRHVSFSLRSLKCFSNPLRRIGKVMSRNTNRFARPFRITTRSDPLRESFHRLAKLLRARDSAICLQAIVPGSRGTIGCWLRSRITPA